MTDTYDARLRLTAKRTAAFELWRAARQTDGFKKLIAVRNAVCIFKNKRMPGPFFFDLAVGVVRSDSRFWTRTCDDKWGVVVCLSVELWPLTISSGAYSIKTIEALLIGDAP